MRRRAVALVAVLAAGLPATGCAVLRGGVVSETTSCAEVSPLANHVAGGGGRLVKIRALTRKDAQKLLDSGMLTDEVSPLSAPRRSCVVVYDGRFAVAGRNRRRARSARYLVLLIQVRRAKVLASYRGDALPRAVRSLS